MLRRLQLLTCAGLIPALVACGAGGGGSSSDNSGTCDITMSQVEQIQPGMELAAVEAILGPGRKDSSYTAGSETNDGYIWCGGGGSSAFDAPTVEITFVNGKASIVQPFNIDAN